MKKILFVCTGNTCRSPMAEYIFNHEVQSRDGSGFIAFSRGVMALDGDVISDGSAAALLEIGIDGTGHSAKPLTREDVDSADYIYVMSQSHKNIMSALFPDTEHDIEFLGGGIDDPFGGGIEHYRKARDEIRNAILDIVEGEQQSA